MTQPSAVPQDISVKDAFDIYQKQSDTLHKLWTYFQIISIAVLGYTLGTEKAPWSIWTYALVSASYVFFATSNLIVIYRSQCELDLFAKAVIAAAQKSGDVGRTVQVRAMEISRVVIFHVLATLVVVGAIWGTWADKCMNKTCPKEAVTTTERSPGHLYGTSHGGSGAIAPSATSLSSARLWLGARA